MGLKGLDVKKEHRQNCIECRSISGRFLLPKSKKFGTLVKEPEVESALEGHCKEACKELGKNWEWKFCYRIV